MPEYVVSTHDWHWWKAGRHHICEVCGSDEVCIRDLSELYVEIKIPELSPEQRRERDA